MGRMIDRRRVMGGSLPYDAEIEYLESTGTQWIDTGVGIGYSTNVLDIQTVFQHLSTSGMYKWVIISILSQNNFIGIQRIGASCYIDGMTNKRVNLVTDTWREYHFNGNDNYEGVDNYQYIPNGGSLTGNIVLFGLNNSQSNAETCRIKYIKISYNNIIVRELIPVRVGQVGYMYDKVSGQLFGNSGIGNFILGLDKETELLVNVNIYVTTHSTGDSNASLDVITGDREPVNIVFNTVLSTPWNNLYIKVKYNTSNYNWEIYAATPCLYDGQVYQSGDLIATWDFREIKDINIVGNYEEIL